VKEFYEWKILTLKVMKSTNFYLFAVMIAKGCSHKKHFMATAVNKEHEVLVYSGWLCNLWSK